MNSSEFDENCLYNQDYEFGLLGYILADNNYIDSVDFMSSEYFYFPQNQECYKIALNAIAKNRVADKVLIRTTLLHNQIFIDSKQDINEYLEMLKFGIIESPRQAGLVIRDLYVKRRSIESYANHIAELRKTPAFDINSTLKKIEEEWFRITNLDSNKSQQFAPLSSLSRQLKINFDEAHKQHEQIHGLKTDFIDLDRHLGGLQKSDLIIIAARPGMGKTALAISMAYNIARDARANYIQKNDLTNEDSISSDKIDGGVGICSLEMSSDQIAGRIFSVLTGKSSKILQTGKNWNKEKGKLESVSEDEYRNIVNFVEEMGSLPIYINDTPSITISTLFSHARRLKRNHNISALFIDYLQLMRATSGISNNRVNEISEISRSLKALAKELDIPVIALSQLSRNVETRDDKRPQLSDLRESGSIEQDADIVAFIYRDAYYSKEDKPDIETVELIVAKHRHGPTGTVNISFEPKYTRFGNVGNNKITEEKISNAMQKIGF